MHIRTIIVNKTFICFLQTSPSSCFIKFQGPNMQKTVLNSFFIETYFNTV